MKIFSPFFRTTLVRAGVMILAVAVTYGLVLHHLSQEYSKNLRLSRRESLRELSSLARNALVPVLVDRNRGQLSLPEARSRAGELLSRVNPGPDSARLTVFLTTSNGRFIVNPSEFGDGGEPWPNSDEHLPIPPSVLKSGFSTYVVEDRPDGPEERLVFVVTLPELDGYLGTAFWMGDLHTSQNSEYVRIAILGLMGFIFLMLPVGHALWSVQVYSRDLEAEVARRRLVELERKRSEERYRVVATQPGQVVYEFDFDEDVFRAWGDEALLSCMEMREGERKTRKEMAAHIHPNDGGQVLEVLEKCRNGDGEHTTEFRLVSGAGQVMHVEARGVAFRTEQDRVCTVLGTLRDITDRKRAEEAIRRSEAKYRNLAKHFPRGIVFIADRDMRLALVDGSGLRQTGVGREDMEGLFLEEVFPPSVSERLLPEVRATFDGEERTLDITFAGRIYHLQLVPVPAGEGESIQVMGVAQDVSAAKLAEKALFESQRKHATLIANMPGLVYRCVYDERRTMEFVSEGCRELTGYDPEDLMLNRKLAWQDLIHPDDLPGFALQVGQAMDEGKSFAHSYRIRTASGEERWVWERGVGVTIPDSPLCAIEGIVLDITERKRAEQGMAESEMRFRRLAQSSFEGIIFTRGTAITDCNRQMEAISGYDRKELLGMNSLGLVLPEDRDRVERAAVNGRQDPYELKTVKKDGAELVVEVRIRQLGGSDPDVLRIAVVRDITDRKRAERALAESETRFRRLAQASFEGIIFSRDHIIEDCNRQMEALTGYSRDQLLGMSSLDLIHEEDQEWVEKAVDEGRQAPYEFRARRSDGTELVVELRVRLLRESGSEKLRITAVRDITERKRTELAMARSLVFEQGLSRLARDLLSPALDEDKLQEALEYLLEAADVCRVYAFENYQDPELGLCCRYIAEACAPGVSAQVDNPDLQGVPYSIIPDWQEAMSRNVPVMGLVADMDPVLRDILGEQDIVSLLVIPIRVAGQWHGFIGFDETRHPRVWEPAEQLFLTTVAGIVGAYLERSIAEKRLREALAELDQIFNSTGEGMALIDLDYNIIRMNEPLAEMFGVDREAIVGCKCHEEGVDERCGTPQCPIVLLSEGVERTQTEFSRPGKDGEGTRYFHHSTNPFRDAAGRVVGMVIGIREITDRVVAEQEAKTREQQLIQADKLAALGTLVTGVAHEINNPNGIITLNAPTLQAIWREARPILDHHYAKNGDFMLGGGNYSDVSEDIDVLFEQVVESGRRIKRIVSELKGFARQELADQTQSVDLNSVGQAAAGLVANKLSKSTDHFTMDWHPGPVYVRGNFQRLEQVIINGLINSCEALTTRDEAIILTVRALPDEGLAEVVITDQGHGVGSEETMNVFDPFFTTKRDVGGTGLGLSVSHGIVVEHGGTMRFESVPGEGSTLSITLPLEREGGD